MPYPLRTIVALVLLLLLAPGANGVTWHVATDGDDAEPGTSDQPFLTIARGVDAAATGDTVLVCDGTYAGVGNRDIDLEDKELTIWSASGNPEACIIDAELDESGSGWVIYSSSSSGGGPFAIKGFTITRGAVGGIGIDEQDTSFGKQLDLRDCIIAATGTGVHVGRWPVSLSGCQFLDCEVGYDGAGLNYLSGSPLDASNCIFDQCGIGASPGGGEGKKTFRNCLFTNNDRGINLGEEDYVDCEDCVFSDNEYGISGWSPWRNTYLRCEFTGNTAAAVHNPAGWPNYNFVTIQSCIVRDNPGDGVVFNGVSLDLIDTEVTNSGGYGVNATVELHGINISNCRIVGNGNTGLIVEPVNGGWGDVPVRVRISNTTIAHNNAGINIVEYEYQDAHIDSTIVAFNTGEALADSGATYTYCDIFGNGPDLEPDSWVPWVNGNLELDPLFCDPESGDYHVSGLSPCTDYLGNAVIGALGVGCDDAVAIDDIEMMARWTDEGVELRWNGSTETFSRVAVLNRRDELAGRTDRLASWPVGAFPHTGQFLDQTAQQWRTYTYSVDAVGDNASGTGVRLESRSALPMVSGLTAIYPNPSNPRATIGYVLARDEKVQLEIYDLSGRRVRKQDLGVVAAGPGEFVWDGTDGSGRNVAAGSYLVRLIAGNTIDTARLVIVK